MDIGNTKIKRRQFLATTAIGIGVAATQPLQASLRQGAGEGVYVSLKDAHKGSLEIDLRIMNQIPDMPQEVQDFYVACREALTGKDADNEIAKVCEKHNVKKLGGPMLGDLTLSLIHI